ncbi:MAG: cysteine desulfurase family protein [Clostridia bacterium]|nr:cysteine desulfurase family protein [Clostridia bacterium]
MTEFYLDNAATTRPIPQAREAALMAMEEYGNPGSLHARGIAARRLLDDSRAALAQALGCGAGSVFFTSGGTESINTALRGAVQKNRAVGKHIVSTQIEHDATLNTLKELKNAGYEITLVSPERDGSISPEALRSALREDTALVTLMGVCNETGAILPVSDLRRAMRAICPRALLHVDGVQTFCKIPLPLGDIDLLSLSAHKIGGLKGSGALYVRPGLSLRPLLFGGGQESGFRSGTEAMPQIAAFAAAARARSASFVQDTAHMSALRDALLQGARARGWFVNTPESGAPHVVNLSPGVGRSEVYIRVLSDQGIYVSGGSACSRGKKSHVLTAMRLPANNVDAALRVSLCPETPAEAVEAFFAAMDRARAMFE